ncbi:MAG: hypothetical protein R3C24_08020 [Cyanobacteriota/Melainabacteria group bacterium]
MSSLPVGGKGDGDAGMSVGVAGEWKTASSPAAMDYCPASWEGTASCPRVAPGRLRAKPGRRDSDGLRQPEFNQRRLVRSSRADPGRVAEPDYGMEATRCWSSNPNAAQLVEDPAGSAGTFGGRICYRPATTQP